MIAIFATDLARGFGIDGHLPWKKLPEDMTHFRNITHGRHIIMGYNTWKTLPDMPYRTSVVITRYEVTSALCMPHDNYIQHIKDLESSLGQEVIVIGGAKILTPELLKACSTIYHTSVKATHVADTFLSAESMDCLTERHVEVLLESPRCVIRSYT